MLIVRDKHFDSTLASTGRRNNDVNAASFFRGRLLQASNVDA